MSDKIMEFHKKNKENIDFLNEYINKTKYGIEIINIHKVNVFFENNFLNILKFIRKNKILIAKKISKKEMILELLNYLIYILLLVVGINNIYRGEITIGEFVSFNIYSNLLMNSLNSIVGIVYYKKEYYISKKRIEKFLKLKETKNKKMINSCNNSYILKNFSLNLDINETKNINIPNKGIIYVSGKSGSGKTTFIKTLLGLNNNYKGEIFFNEKNKVSYLPQSLYLFNYNIYDNIFLGRIENEKDKIIIKNLKIDKLYKNFQKDIETCSGGEKQRISIARALVNDPNVIFLDEFDNGLDLENKFIIYDELERLSKNKLIIIISHNFKKNIKNGINIIIEDNRIKY